METMPAVVDRVENVFILLLRLWIELCNFSGQDRTPHSHNRVFVLESSNLTTALHQQIHVVTDALPVPEDDIFYQTAIKTGNNQPRLTLFLYIHDACVLFFLTIGIDVVSTDCVGSHTRTGLCCKSKNEFMHYFNTVTKSGDLHRYPYIFTELAASLPDQHTAKCPQRSPMNLKVYSCSCNMLSAVYKIIHSRLQTVRWIKWCLCHAKSAWLDSQA